MERQYVDREVEAEAALRKTEMQRNDVGQQRFDNERPEERKLREAEEGALTTSDGEFYENSILRYFR